MAKQKKSWLREFLGENYDKICIWILDRIPSDIFADYAWEMYQMQDADGWNDSMADFKYSGYRERVI